MLMAHPHPELQFTHLLPYGALLHDRGVQFVVFSRSATAMRLLLYDHVRRSRTGRDHRTLIQDTDRWGDIWSIFVPGIGTRPAVSLPGRRAVRSGARASGSTRKRG